MMTMDNPNLDQIEDNDRYDLRAILESFSEFTDENYDSPFENCALSSHYFNTEDFGKLHNDLNNHFSYFHLNCRSLSHNWENFYDLISELHGDTFAFDVIGLSEVFKCDRDDRLHLQNYQKLLTRTRDDSVRGGVGLFIKDGIDYHIREDLSVFIPHVYESLFIEIHSNSMKPNHIIGVIYRPNSPPRANMDIFSTTFHMTMEMINNEKKTCVIMGDLNLDLLKYSTHDKTNNFLDQVVANGFLPAILKPTRIDKSSATLLDHIYTNINERPCKSGIITTDVADHFGIFYTTQNKRTRPKPETVLKRIISEKNTKIFKNLLENIDFSDILTSTCPKESYSSFHMLYTSAFYNAFPMKIIKPSRRYTKIHAWMTKGLLTSMRKKSKMYHKKVKKPTKENTEKYKSYVNLYNKLKRQMKINYYNKEISDNKNNIKKTWTILKQALGKQNNQPKFPKLFTIENRLISDKKEIANSFNDYFSTIGNLTGQKVKQTHKHFSDYLKNSMKDSMFLETVEETEVLNIVNKLKPKTSSGYDEIPTKILKDTIHLIVKPLTHIVNLSLTYGIVPDQLKIGKVVPIYKAGEKNIMSNYRPISLLPAFSKIFEKIMYIKIMSYLNSNNLLYKHQYGFRPKHNTTHPIIHLLNKIADAQNDRPRALTLTVLFDLSKAFDVIDTNILIRKLDHYGIRGIVKEWLISYLTNRTQYVEFENTKSSVCNVNCGVPQGSILGPLLYLIYVNDIANASNDMLLSFADDTTLIVNHNNINTLFVNANIEVQNLYNWFCANRLSLNANKTKYLIFRSPHRHRQIDFTHLNIEIDNIKLTRVGHDQPDVSTKFLGVWLDETLNWKYNIKKIGNKISKSLYMINQIKNFIPQESLKTLYFAMIQPHICYQILAWANSTSAEKGKIFKLQKRAMRTINKTTYNAHTDPLFKKSKIMKLDDQLKYESILFMYDYMTHKLPPSFNNMFTTNQERNPHVHTRQSNMLHIPRCDTTFSRNLPPYALPMTWNHYLQAHPTYNIHVDATVSRSKFKYDLKNEIFNKYSTNVDCDNPRCRDCNPIQ